MAILGILREELRNSQRMEKSYLRALQRLPAGALVRKRIGRRDYFYLAKREGRRVRFVYLRRPSPARLARHEQAKIQRARFRRLLAQVRRQIRFLRKVVDARPAI